jgi:hypothetical protein
MIKKITRLLLDLDRNELLYYEEAEQLIDLCRQLNRSLKNNCFTKLIDEIETYVMNEYNESTIHMFFNEHNIQSQIACACELYATRFA